MRDVLSQALRRRKKDPLSLKGYSSCAVLIPLFLKRGEYHVLYIQRGSKLRDHAGQIGFPGGRRESSDRDLRETALRETEEELGLPREKIEILGELSEIFTPTRYCVKPFVGLIPTPLALRLDPGEVEGLIEVPLSHLLKPESLKIEPLEFFDRPFEMPYFHFENHVIWGATGRMTRELVGLLKRQGKKAAL